jgi:hypothetical protein
MSSEQVQAVLDDPEFAREMLNNLKAGAIVSQDLLNYINSIPERKKLEIDIAMKTPEGMQKLFDEARGNAEEYFNVIEDSISIKFKNPMKEAENAVSAIQDELDSLQQTISTNFDKPINILNNTSEVLSHDLSLIDDAAQAINDKYDIQSQTLQKISDLNSEITNQERQKLTLADALTRGDISAAAVAAQDIRSASAENIANKQQQVLDVARQLEIDNLRSGTGLTRAQIEQQQYQISQQIYTLEQSRKIIEDQISSIQTGTLAKSQARLNILNKQQQSELDTIDAQRDKWIQAQNAIDIAKVNSDKFKDSMVLNESLTKNLAIAWSSVNDKTVTLTINEVRNVNTINTGSSNYGGLSGAGQAGGGGSSTQKKMYGGKIMPMNYGGMVPKYMAMGGTVGSDTIPAMLTPGEFVMNKAATKAFGPALKKINDSKYPSMLSGANLQTPTYITASSNVVAPNNVSSSNYTNNNSSAVYNYNVGITVSGSNSNANEIARSVVKQIKNIDSQRIGGQRV